MATGDDLLRAVRDYLEQQGVVRRPTQAGPLPPLWLHPEGGAVAPGDKRPPEDGPAVVVSAFFSGGVPMRAYESFLRRDAVQFWMRATRAPHAFAVERELRDLLVADLGRRDWSMAGLRVVASEEWRPMQPAPAAGPGHAFTWSCLFDYDA